MRELPAARGIGTASEQRGQHLIRRYPDTDVEPEVTIVGNEDVLAPFECHRGSRLHRFMPFACGSERNFTLPVQLKSAILQRPLHKHRAHDGNELLVGEPLPLEGGFRLAIGRHKAAIARVMPEILRQQRPSERMANHTGMQMGPRVADQMRYFYLIVIAIIADVKMELPQLDCKVPYRDARMRGEIPERTDFYDTSAGRHIHAQFRIDVDSDGRAAGVALLESSGSVAFDAYARQQLAEMKYDPAIFRCVPVVSTLYYGLEYTI
jgi:hypothetical protein